MTDVLVVGAGPTGLALAVTLRQFGVRVRIIDRAAKATTVSKALAVWSASLEALQGMGAAEAFVAEGVRLRALSLGHGDHELARLAVGVGIDSPFGYPLLVPQSRTEALLTERLSSLGVEVERGLELTGLEREMNGVVATLRRPDGSTEAAQALYLGGCDGAGSFVRHALEIPFEGFTEPETYLLGDVRIAGGKLDRRGIYIRWRNDSSIALFPFGEDVWRIVTARDDAALGQAPPSLEELQALTDRHGPRGLRLSDATWLSAFKINERLAARYRKGRCFLAGDAAHIHSPAGGQGMNTGLQDAVNLGWKLAHAVSGHGDRDLLLQSYEAERRPVAKAVVAAAAQKLRLGMAPSKLGLARDAAVAVIGRLPVVQRRLQAELSETEIVYRGGGLVTLGAPPRRAGRGEAGARALDAELGDGTTLWPRISRPCHSLMLFGVPAARVASLTKPAGERLQVMALDPRQGTAARRYRVRGPGWVLIRPDQVVAARGSLKDLTRLETYLARVLAKT